ncbi:MAG: ComF family protein [Alphaproteobacteria bacterium]|jgi:ComF family protein|nr:ComF family protein [Alphaproteobacteria bacterium]
MFLKSIVIKLLNFIYPPKCYLCSADIASEGLCSECFPKLQVAYKHYCHMCGIELKVGDRCLGCQAKPKNFNSVSYCFVYSPEVFKLIGGFKNNDKTYMAKFLSSFMIKKVNESGLANKIDIIIPVPIHYAKLIKRKYNHTGLLAKEIAKHFNKPFRVDVLQKTKKTADQMTLGSDKRLKNIKGAFNIKKNHLQLLKDKNILLVDDVLTTGATINECAKVLKRAGCSRVHVLCFARVDGILKV